MAAPTPTRPQVPAGPACSDGELAAVVAELAARRDAGERLTTDDYRRALERLGKPFTPGTEGWLRKKVAAVRPADKPASARIDIDPREYMIQMAMHPTLAAFFAWLVARFPGLHPSSARRHMKRFLPPPLLAVLRSDGGMEKYRARILAGYFHAERFLQSVQVDVHHLAVKAIPDGKGYRRAVPVKIVLALDDSTRSVLAWRLVAVTDARDVKASDVAAVLAGVVTRWGVPGRFLFDNGAEFANTVTSKLALVVKTAVTFAPRYRGEGKGKVERFFRSLVVWMARSYPSWAEGPSSSGRHAVQGGSVTNAPRLAELELFVADILDRYDNRSHRALGGLSPAQARAADPHLAVAAATVVPLEKVLRFVPVHMVGSEDEFHYVDTGGVTHRNHRYLCLDLVQWPGCPTPSPVLGKYLGSSKPQLRVREVPGDGTRIGLYDRDDQLVCIATREDKVTEAERVAHSTAMRELLRLGERVLAEAHDRLEDDTPAVEEPEGDCRSLFEIAADELNTVATNLRRRRAGFTHNDERVETNGLVVDDPAVTVGVEAAIRLMRAFVRLDASLELYRLDTPNQAVIYQPGSPAELHDKHRDTPVMYFSLAAVA